MQYSIFVVLTLGLTVLIGFGTYRTTKLLRVWRPDRNLLLDPADTLLRLGIIGLCWGLGRLSGVGANQLGWRVSGWRIQTVWGIAWGIAIAATFYVTTRWIIRRTSFRYYSSTVIEAVLPRNRSEVLLVALAMASVVLMEELLFRSLLLGGLSVIIPAPVLLLITGIVFGLMHSPQGLWGMIGASAGGIVLGALFLASGTLLMPIVAHYVTNILQIFIALHGQTIERRSL